jgi:hypothetical protein
VLSLVQENIDSILTLQFSLQKHIVLSIVDPKAYNELGNPLNKNLSDILLETKVYKVIRLTAICDHLAILCN